MYCIRRNFKRTQTLWILTVIEIVILEFFFNRMRSIENIQLNFKNVIIKILSKLPYKKHESLKNYRLNSIMNYQFINDWTIYV